MHTPAWFTRLRLGRWTAIGSHCAICRHWPGEPLCETCIARFASPLPRCSRCALPTIPSLGICTDCTRQAPLLHRCHAAVSYNWPWANLLAQFKFREQTGWADSLALLMRSSPWADDTLHEADVVVPMPLAPERLAQRGFNQSWLLAEALAPDKADPLILQRIRHTPAQHSLSRTQRLANLDQAFAVDPTRQAQVRGRHLVLVDDVMTTGASLHAGAQALLQAGASHVSAIVFARTDPGMTDAG